MKQSLTDQRKDLDYYGACDKLWNRWECRLWTANLFAGTCVLYAARAALPICATAIANEYSWNKTDAGTVLSCFFWGYACTQVISGRWADRIGGEKILRISTLVWALLTFFTPDLFDISYRTTTPMIYVIAVRSATAFHLPAMASMTSRHLTSVDKGRVFGICLAGSHLGTVLAGAVGSMLLDAFGWRALFQFVGIISFVWWLLLRCMTAPRERLDTSGEMNKSSESKASLLGGVRKSSASSTTASSDCENAVPWTMIFKHSAFWGAAIAQYCGANAYYTMFSWLPSYFADSFPHAKGVVYNVVPSLAIVITAFCSPFLASRAFMKIRSLTTTRKLMEGSSLLAMALCLLFSCRPMSFNTALIVFTLAMAARGLHHGGVSVNPCDFAPHHTGAVFGVFNAFSAITGFIGVYIAGYILQETSNNWSYVFIFTSFQCVFGAIVYILFGTASRII